MQIDHFLFTAPRLEEGMEYIGQLLGVRPAYGGQHPNLGTHNALLSLGNSTYLEIIAPCPDLPAPPHGLLFQEHFPQGPKLTTWVLRTEKIAQDHRRAIELGVPLGDLQAGSRLKQDGTSLSWKVSNPYALPMNGAVPFLIDWGNTPHPAASAPQAGQLSGFRIEHPQALELEAMLEALQMNVPILPATAVKMTLSVQTPNGVVDIV